MMRTAREGCSGRMSSTDQRVRMTAAGTSDAHVESEHIPPDEQERWELRRVVSAFGKTWRIPLIATLVLLVLIVGVLAALRTILPTTTTFISQFHFTFPTAESGRFPNGLPFTVNEILDPAILDAVYHQLELDKHGIEREKFYGGFSIRPFLLTEGGNLRTLSSAIVGPALVVR